MKKRREGPSDTHGEPETEKDRNRKETKEAKQGPSTYEADETEERKKKDGDGRRVKRGK